jgi:DNA-binding NarL/FixJ family response regulator
MPIGSSSTRAGEAGPLAGPRTEPDLGARPRDHPVRVLVVDDHEVVREGLAAALSSDGQFEIVAAVSTAAAALAVAARTRPEVALVDLRLPDMMGDRLCSEFRARFPAIAVVVLSSYVSEDTVRNAMEAGASAYITKAAGLSELRKALAGVVAAASEPAAPQILEQLHDLVSRRRYETTLTPQQERVLELSAMGLTYREIGARLFISESTVRFHMQKLKGKFGARTKTELIATAIRSGALPPAAEDLGGAR